MNKMKILITLNNVEQAKEFNRMAMKQSYEIDLKSGHYFIDAKSILGIFSLDLSKPVEVILHIPKGEDATELINFLESLKPNEENISGR